MGVRISGQQPSGANDMKFVTNAMPHQLPAIERAFNATQIHKGEPLIVRLVTKDPVEGTRFTADELKAAGWVSVWKEPIVPAESPVGLP